MAIEDVYEAVIKVNQRKVIELTYPNSMPEPTSTHCQTRT